MTDQGDTLIDRIMHRRYVKRWGRAADAAASTDLETLRALRGRARQVGRELERLVHMADGRLQAAAPEDLSLGAPLGTEWSWRPELWTGPVRPRGLVAAENRSRLGQELTLFHDCPLSEITLEQQRIGRSAASAPYGLALEVFHFTGSFLSLVIDLPAEGVQGLQLRHLVWLGAKFRSERPMEIFARLNIRHGPNTEQLTREIETGSEEVLIEFDLAYTRLNEKRVERAWIDLIFGDPACSGIVIEDLALGRRPRAEL